MKKTGVLRYFLDGLGVVKIHIFLVRRRHMNACRCFFILVINKIVRGLIAIIKPGFFCFIKLNRGIFNCMYPESTLTEAWQKKKRETFIAIHLAETWERSLSGLSLWACTKNNLSSYHQNSCINSHLCMRCQ